MSEDKTLTRADISAAVRKTVSVSKVEADQLVSNILKHMCQTLSHNENITIARFGAFRIFEKGDRQGRNMKTGKACVISARRTVTFRPCDEMRRLVAKGLQK